MRYLILADLHSNLEALDAVLEDARGAYERVLCCGDLIGYGADPNRVLDWARANVNLAVRGNHDRGCAGLEDLEWFRPLARCVAVWTSRQLNAENLHYLRELPKGPLTVDTFQLAHGSPLDEDEYLTPRLAEIYLKEYAESELCFFGHTHKQEGFLLQRGGMARIEAPVKDAAARALRLERGSLHALNPGSVGQPRDGDPRAAYLLYDSGERLAEFRRVAYDIVGAQAKILRAGLPEHLAERLAAGR